MVVDRAVFCKVAETCIKEVGYRCRVECDYLLYPFFTVTHEGVLVSKLSYIWVWLVHGENGDAT